MATNVDLKSLNLRNIDFGKVKNFLLNFLIPLVSLGLMLALVLLVLKPSYTSIPKLESDLSSKQNLSLQLTKKVDDLEFLVDYEQVLSEKSLLINEALISEPEIPELLAQVDQMVKESGMTVSRLNYSAIKESPDEIEHSLVGVALGVKGSPTQLLSLLEIIEKASRLVLVEDFRYSLNKQEGSSFLDVNFELLAPYLFVTSEAVTDESINIDISSPEFEELTDRLEVLKRYDILPTESAGSEESEESEVPESFPLESPTPAEVPEIPSVEPVSLEPEIGDLETSPIEPASE